MLHYIICHVLLPKDSNLSQINDLEMQVIFVVKNKIKVNWLPTMLYHLKQLLTLKTRLLYGHLISRILESTDMVIGREPFIVMTTTANEINEVTIMKNTDIVQCNEGSYKYDNGAIKSLRNLVLSSRNLPEDDDEGDAGSEAEGEDSEDMSDED
ncbi:hypothetical protein KIW84_062174 [Lathyrus oleraceus]|uniref:Uncharacterized protein n=1 Tax=Pisum sativum TaxID=3888 RepID=A0A9D5A393_PEA|nr:hypothetical protein KIW84_062174 [Pisum sativum]